MTPEMYKNRESQKAIGSKKPQAVEAVCGFMIKQAAFLIGCQPVAALAPRGQIDLPQVAGRLRIFFTLTSPFQLLYNSRHKAAAKNGGQ